MRMRSLITVFLLLVVVGSVLADKIEGTLGMFDAKTGTIYVKVGEAQKFFKVAPTTKYYDADNKELADGLKDAGFKEGVKISVTTEKDGKKMVTKEVRLQK